MRKFKGSWSGYGWSACAAGMLFGLLPAVASAESRVGNGGDAIVCFEEGGDAIKSVQLLDFVEWGTIAPALSFPGSPVEKAVKALERFARFDPERSARFVKAAKNWDNDASIEDRVLKDIRDSMHDGWPRNCEVQQLAIQREQRGIPENKLYAVSSSLWDKLSPEHQAGLIIHEVIYTDALDRGMPDSVMTRYLTAKVASAELETMTPQAYQEMIEGTGFHAQHWFDYEGDRRVVFLPRAARTVQEASAACKRVEEDFKLPTSIKLEEMQLRLAASDLGALISDNEIESAEDVYLWSSTKDDSTTVCGADGGQAVKVLKLPTHHEPNRAEAMCGSSPLPLTICVVPDFRDPDDGDMQDEPQQDDGGCIDSPNQNDDPAQDDVDQDGGVDRRSGDDGDPTQDDGCSDEPTQDEPTQDDDSIGDDRDGDEPKGDEPKGDEPKGDEPKGDEPKGDEPKGDAPTQDDDSIDIDAPKGEEPKGDEPTDDPKSKRS